MNKNNEYYNVSLEETLEDLYDFMCITHIDGFLKQEGTNLKIYDEKEAEKVFTEFEKRHPDIHISFYDGILYMNEIGE